jgi:hypothetical protein
MTCAHVLDIIDAGPFAACLPEDITAAVAHARACARCGAAMATSNFCAENLNDLPLVEPPPDLERMVMTRIAHLEELPPAAQPVSRAWPVWAVATGGVAAAVASVIELAGVRKVLPSRPELVLVVLTLSLLIYSAGLFAALPTRIRQSPPSFSPE